jgi:hypothetical protein
MLSGRAVYILGSLHLAGAPRLAPSGAGLWLSLCGMLLPPAPQPAGGLLGLLEILLAGAPENDAAGHTPDRNRDVELAGDLVNVVFHALRPDLRAQMDADRLGRQRLNFGAERLIEHGLHAGPTTAHPAGFVEGDVFELKRG